MNLVYCGYGRAGMECLLQLLAGGKLVKKNILVFTHDREDNLAFLYFLKSAGIKFYTSNVNIHLDIIRNFQPSALVSVYYRYIIKPELLSLVNGRAMNLHPSLLPDYKGCFSSAWALINGETKTGITFHLMEEGIDTGNILYQEEVEIDPDDTAYLLYHKLVSLFVKRFNEIFNLLISGEIGKPQSKEGNFKYYGREVPYGGVINPAEFTFEAARNYCRGMHYPPFPGAKIKIGNDAVEIREPTELKNYKDLFRK